MLDVLRNSFFILEDLKISTVAKRGMGQNDSFALHPLPTITPPSGSIVVVVKLTTVIWDM